MQIQTVLVYIGVFFAIGVSATMMLFILDIFWSSTSHTPIFANGTKAATFIGYVNDAIANMGTQLPNAGKLLGVGVIIGVVALFGIGGYMGYRAISKK
jgi:hypothetical protein